MAWQFRPTILLATTIGLVTCWSLTPGFLPDQSACWAQESDPTTAEPAGGESSEEEAQDDAPESAATIADSSNKPAAIEFEAVFAEWKALLKEMRDLRAQFQIADDDQAAQIKKDFQAKIVAGREMEPKLQQAALAAFRESPNEDRELVRFLITIVADQIRDDNYQAATDLVTELIDGGCQEKELNDLAGIAAFGTNDFTNAEKYLNAAKEEGTISSQASNFLAGLQECQANWDKELELRDAETAADDLPRVKLETEVGDIVIELFENEAPETVGNIISLVEKGFYDGLGFHRVLNGFMAQGGCPQGDGSGGPGYNIYCECVNENHRKHFAGSLSMAKQAARNTGGSQFFITFVPTPFLNGQHTVFGRVIEGWDVLPKIVKRDPDGAPPFPNATKITKATVVRKRDHDYRPNKVK